MPIIRSQLSTNGRSTHVAEFSTPQAVFFLCIALGILGAAFVAGRLLAGVDRPITMASQSPAAETAKGTDSGAPATAATPVKDGSPASASPANAGPTQTYTIAAVGAGAPKAATPAQPATAGAAAPKASTPPAPAASAPPSATPGTAATPPPAAVEPAVPAPSAPTAPPKAAQVIPPPIVPQPREEAEAAAKKDATTARVTELPPLSKKPETQAPSAAEEKAAQATPSAQTNTAAPAAQGQLVAMDPPVIDATPAPPVDPKAPPAAKTTTEATPAKNAKDAKASKEAKDAKDTKGSKDSKDAKAKGKADAAADTASDKTTGTAKSGNYAVQLGSFDGSERQTKAQTLQKHVKKVCGLSAQIQDSEKEKIARVLLTGYKDKNAASTACTELRKKPGMSGAFVRAI